jgi:ectoine hydroxylase-related dioxygenase (phytanoyl-CoA dioxygenase family)
MEACVANLELQNRMAGYIEDFARQGFLVLPKFFDDAVIDGVQAAIDRVKLARPMDVVIDNLEHGERTVLGLMTAEAVAHDRMKVNDLYLGSPEQRALALAPGLVPILWALLGHVPALCNSLYLEKGSAQDPHVDSLYMTPRTQGHLIASWVALEDTHEAAGPLEYYPGSHLFEQFRFGDGGYHANDAQMPEWRAYMAARVAEAGLKIQRFAARKGDVFIWHAHLLHGGGPIADYARTRKSCVFHYFSEADARASGCALARLGGAYWINRAPQPLPAEVAARLPFSEASYLRRYPDVAAAVQAGQFQSGQAHFESHGRREGRLPC